MGAGLMTGTESPERCAARRDAPAMDDLVRNAPRVGTDPTLHVLQHPFPSLGAVRFVPRDEELATPGKWTTTARIGYLIHERLDVTEMQLF